jgi:hypothetical protein
MADQQPNYTAYTVIKREGQDDFWIAIGGAWMHQDGDGYNVILQALPIDGKIVLRPPKADTKSPEVQGAQQAIRDENDRRKGARPREVATVDAPTQRKQGSVKPTYNCAAGPASVKRSGVILSLRARN